MEFSFLNRKKKDDELQNVSNQPKTNYQGLGGYSLNKGTLQGPQSTVAQNEAAKKKQQSTLNYTPAPQTQPKPQQQPQNPNPTQRQAAGYNSALQAYLDRASSYADQRAQRAAQAPQRIAEQQGRVLDVARQQAEGQGQRAQQRFDLFKQNQMAQLGDLQRQGDITRENIQTNRDEAIRNAVENTRSSRNQLQGIFAGLNTLDSGAFQRLMANQQSKFEGQQQGIYRDAAQDLNDVETSLLQAQRNADQLIQEEQLNLQDTLAAIDSTLQKGTLEYQAAVENAIAQAEDSISGIYQSLAQTEDAANLKMQELMMQLANNQDPVYGVSDQFLQTGVPQTREDLIYRAQNPDAMAAITGQTGSGDMTEKQRAYTSAANIAQNALNTLNQGGVASGPGQGLIGQFGEAFGTNTEAQQQYRSDIAAARTAIRNALLGANMSPSEMESIMAAIPDFNDDPRIARIKLERLIQNAQIMSGQQGGFNQNMSMPMQNQTQAPLSSFIEQ